MVLENLFLGSVKQTKFASCFASNKRCSVEKLNLNMQIWEDR